jgi:hypothetical protein
MSGRGLRAGSRDPFESAVPPSVEIEEGRVSRQPIVSAAGSGYLWDLQEVEGPGKVHMSVETGSLSSPSFDDLPTNTSAPLHLVVTGLREGTARWRARLIRPWMPESPLVDQLIAVTVRRPASLSNDERNAE